MGQLGLNEVSGTNIILGSIICARQTDIGVLAIKTQYMTQEQQKRTVTMAMLTLCCYRTTQQTYHA